MKKPIKNRAAYFAAFTLVEVLVILTITVVLCLLVSMSLRSSCIVEGSLVATPDGARPIETLKIGDKVLCYGSNQEKSIGTITAVYEGSAKRHFKLTTADGATLTATGAHPVGTPGGWVKVDDLRIGDKILTSNGAAEIETINVMVGERRVFDLSVEPHQNFFADGVLVHNKTTRRMRTKTSLAQLSAAMEKYRDDFSTFPPVNYPTGNGSEVLPYHFLKEFKEGNKTYGPYLAPQLLNDSDKNGYVELLTPYNKNYSYSIVGTGENAKFLIIDPGPDGKLGGHIEPEKGFISDNSGLDKDNVTSENYNE